MESPWRPGADDCRPSGSSHLVHHGGSSIGGPVALCDSMYRGDPVNTVRPLLPGKYCAFAWVYVDMPEGTECEGTCELAVTPRGDDSQNFPGLSNKITPPSGKWTLISLSSLGGNSKIGDVLRPGQEFPNGRDAGIHAQQIIHRPGLNQAAAQPA